MDSEGNAEPATEDAVFDNFRLVMTAPDCPQIIAHEARSRSFLGFDPIAERMVELRAGLHGEESGEAAAVDRGRIERRAQRWSRVRHAGIATALGWGDWDGSLVVVSEFVDGEPLLEYGERVGALPPELALSVVLQTADIAALAGEHDWLAPLNLNDFAVDYDERDCLRVRLFNVGLFRGSPPVRGTDQRSQPLGEAAARRWFRRLVVLLDRLRSGRVLSDHEAFDAEVDRDMPDDGSLAGFFDRLVADAPEEGAWLGAPPSAVSRLMKLLRKGVLAVSGVEEPTAARCYGCRPRSRWGPVGPLPARIYGDRVEGGDGLQGGMGLADAAFDDWLESRGAQRWWQPPHRLSGVLREKHLGVSEGKPVHVQLFPPANYAPGYDQNQLISSMQDSRLRGHDSLVRTYAVNWDEELTYTLEEPLDGFRLCDWAACHEDLPAANVVEMMFLLSGTLHQLETLAQHSQQASKSPNDPSFGWKWPVDPWAVWISFGTDRELDRIEVKANSASVLAASPRDEWPRHFLKIRLGPSWERMTLAASGVWSAVRTELMAARSKLYPSRAVDDSAAMDFATLIVWLAQYETLAASLRAAPPNVIGVRAAVTGNEWFCMVRDWLPVLIYDGFAGRQLVLYELSDRFLKANDEPESSDEQMSVTADSDVT